MQLITRLILLLVYLFTWTVGLCRKHHQCLPECLPPSPCVFRHGQFITWNSINLTSFHHYSVIAIFLNKFIILSSPLSAGGLFIYCPAAKYVVGIITLLERRCRSCLPLLLLCDCVKCANYLSPSISRVPPVF